jgi:hypothetical protein
MSRQHCDPVCYLWAFISGSRRGSSAYLHADGAQDGCYQRSALSPALRVISLGLAYQKGVKPS